MLLPLTLLPLIEVTHGTNHNLLYTQTSLYDTVQVSLTSDKTAA